MGPKTAAGSSSRLLRPTARPTGPQGYSLASPRPVLGQSSGGLFAAPASKNSRVSEFGSFWKEFNQFLSERICLNSDDFLALAIKKRPRGLAEDWPRTRRGLGTRPQNCRARAAQERRALTQQTHPKTTSCLAASAASVSCSSMQQAGIDVISAPLTLHGTSR